MLAFLGRDFIVSLPPKVPLNEHPSVRNNHVPASLLMHSR
jgi:hypothetical protein